jgi:hypothetical protein
MDWKKIADRAKEQIDKRGGTEGLKRDATKMKDIARGPGSLTDKAKQAAEALKPPATEEQGPTEPQPTEAEPTEAQPTEPQPTEAQRSK